MDLRQQKLTKKEWESLEVPVNGMEKNILQMIDNGYNKTDIYYNNNKSLTSFLKIEPNTIIHHYLYEKYFKKGIDKINKKYHFEYVPEKSSKLQKLNSSDTVKIQNLDENIDSFKKVIFEYLLIELCSYILKYIYKKKSGYISYLYSIIQIRKSSIININTTILDYVDKVINFASPKVTPNVILQNAHNYIERNEYLLSSEDKVLFEHQKDIFNLFKTDKQSKIVLYCAPTGTGKTLTPIGLSNQYKIIFVCVARHIGLALAKSCIALGKKIAFAFGSDTADEIRLHYFSASSHFKHELDAKGRCVCKNPKCHKIGQDIKYKNGSKKIDNSDGSKVEIMICDVRSYITSMHYMCAFNNKEDIITYWDEPTITLDSETHELHDVINRNWSQNKIPNVVLSCATLPKQDEIKDVIEDFKGKFEGSTVYNINSYDCKKSIPILSKSNVCMLPHNMYESYEDLQKCVKFCKKNKTLLRYFDVEQIVEYIYYLHENKILEKDYIIDNYFNSISDITMNSLKNYYLQCLEIVKAEHWPNAFKYFKCNEKNKFSKTITRTMSLPDSHIKPGEPLRRTQSVFDNTVKQKSGILFTTEDAHTLTDGPTIYLCEDVSKIGKFYIQQSKIPSPEFQKIMAKINKNNDLTKKIDSLDAIIKSKEEAKGDEDSFKEATDRESKAIINEINKLRKQIMVISLDYKYIPNTTQHQKIWVGEDNVIENAFVPNIDEESIKNIMLLNVDNTIKVLLILGIGVLIDVEHSDYNEIMKKLAEQQRLFIIIASSDYIYGTNYQFCHGIIGKDLEKMTQQKTMQALGRIGRNQIQQTYSIRFRDDDFIYRLLEEQTFNLEAVNMNKLFSTTI